RLSELIRKGLVDINARYKNNETILQIAAQEGIAPEIIWLLIDAGAEVDAKNDDHYTPLHVAAQYSNLGGVKALVARKADPNAVDKSENFLKNITEFSFLSPGRPPLYFAQANDKPTKNTLEIIKFLEP